MKNILILGATSEIASEFIELLPKDSILYLAARNPEKMKSLLEFCRSHDLQAQTISVDFSDLNFPSNLFFSSIHTKIDTIISFVGSMGGQDQLSADNLREVHAINFLNPVKTILYFLPELKKKEKARIIFISSVAGERGRKKNFVYGSAKGALTIFASGLRAELQGTPVHVSTILLGLVNTRMTKGMKSPLIASKKRVAREIYESMKNGKDISFIPSYWRPVMFMIRMIPENIFKKMSF